MFGEIIEDLREGLGVSAQYDSRLLRAIQSSARQLLIAYNFRDSVRKAVTAIAANAQSVVLPVDAGKVKAVRLHVLDGGVHLYKRLRRREEGQLPVYGGPNFYYTEGLNIILDSPMPSDAIGYEVEIWYQSIDPTVNETWLSGKYPHVLEHLTGAQHALKLRKPEAAQMYGSMWSLDVEVLGRYLPELDFSDSDLSMGENRTVMLERYPAV